MTVMPTQPMMRAITTVIPTITATITTMIMSKRLRFSGSAHTAAIFTSIGL